MAKTAALTLQLPTPLSLPFLPKGAISEILGNPSSGRTALALSLLAAATQAGEVAAMVDCNNSFDPVSAKQAGVDLGKTLWVQCSHNLQKALRAADMILHSGGFGVILLDVCHVAAAEFQRVPSSCWYRFQRALEPAPSSLLILARQSIAKSCSRRQFALESRHVVWQGQAPFRTLQRVEFEAVSRKPMGVASTLLVAEAREAS